MKNDDKKNSQSESQSIPHKKSETKKATDLETIANAAKDKQKQLDKIKALEKQADKLKAKEFREQKSEQRQENSDLVADKSAGSLAENHQSPTDDEQVAAVGANTEQPIAASAAESPDEMERDKISDARETVVTATDVESNGNEVAQQGHRIGKGGGVTTPAGITFDLTQGVKGGLLTTGFIAAVHGETTPVTGSTSGGSTFGQTTVPDHTVQTTPEQVATTVSAQVPDKIDQQIPNPTLPPQLTPGKVPTPVPHAIPQATPSATPGQIPNPTLPPQLTPGQVPNPVPHAIPQATPSATPGQIPNPTLPPQLTPGQVPNPVPHVIPQATPSATPGQIPNPTLPPQLAPGQVPNPVPHAIPQATPTAIPGKIPQPLHQEIPLSASITINAITKDNIVNTLEAKADVHVTGQVGGDVIDGDLVTLTVNGKPFTGSVQAGTFEIKVSGSELAIDTNVQAQVTVSNANGRFMTATDGQVYSVDTSVDAPVSIAFENTGTDSIYNQAEVGTDGKVNAVVFLPPDSKVGDIININGLDSKLSNENINHGVFVLEVKPGTEIKASITDAVGNTSVEVKGTAPDADLTISATDDLNTAIEDQSATATFGNVLSNDDQDGTHLTFTNGAGDIAGKYGTFHFKSDGSYTYELDNSKVQSFAQGEQHNDSTSYTVTDAAGNSTTAELKIEITGTADKAVISGKDIGDVNEDADGDLSAYGAGAGGFGYDLTTKGKLTISDADAGQDYFPQGHGSATWYHGDHGGQLIISRDGHWTYDIYNAAKQVQELGQGESLVDTVTVHSADGTEHQIKITVHGTNDAPTIQAKTLAVTEGGDLLQGQMQASDVDKNDQLTFSLTKQVDGLTLNNDGSYSFDPKDASYDYLAAGQQLTLTIPVTVTDKSNATSTNNLLINLTGTNDSALISGPSAADLTEDINPTGNYLYSSGQLASSDIDNPDNQFIAESLATDINGQATIGHLDIGPHGLWTYHIDNTKIQNLNDGDSLVERFSVHSADGTSHEIVATVQGKTDVPAAIVMNVPNLAPMAVPNANPMAVPYQVPVAQVAHVPASAIITIDDITHDNIINAAESKQQVHVTGTVNGDVKDGELVTLTVNHQTFTGHAKSGIFNVLVNGIDLAADNKIQAEVTGTSSTGDVTTVSIEHNYAVDTDIDVNVHSFSLNSANSQAVVQIYLPGDSHIMELTIVSSGGGQPLVLDPTSFYSQSSSTRHPDHRYVDFRGVDLSSLADGELTVQVKAQDNAGNIVSSSGSGRYPVMLDTQVNAQDDVNTAVEDQGAKATQGNVLTNDDQDGTHLTFGNNAADITGKFGTFHFKADGSYTYDLDNSKVQQLNTQDVVADSASYTVIDAAGNSTTAELKISITGTNDAAIITGDTSATAYEKDADNNAQVIVRGHLSATDVDNPDNDFFAEYLVYTPSGGKNNMGFLRIEANGDWYYDVGGVSLDNFNDGDTHLDKFEIRTQDGTSHEIDIMVVGGPNGLTVNMQSPTLVTSTPTPVLPTQHTPASAVITLDDITPDNVINAVESGQKVHVTGTVGGDVKDGDVVTITVNNQAVTGKVNTGVFDVLVNGSDLIADQKVHAEVVGTSSTGDVTTASAEQHYTVDTTAPTLVFKASNITQDNIINAQEAGKDIDVDGNIAGDYQAGDLVTLTVNGKDFTCKVPDNGHFIIAIPGSDLAADVNNQITGKVTSVDSAGNRGSATATYHYGVDTSAPTLVFKASNITQDNIINAQEASTSIDVDGNIAGDYQAGDLVTLTVNGKDFTGKVPDNGHFTIAIPGSDLVADGNNQIIGTVISVDNAGNTGSATATYHYSVDTTPAIPVIQAAHQSGGHAITVQSSSHGGFALDSSGSTSFHSTWGTAHINPNTGEISFSPIMTHNPNIKHHQDFDIFQNGQHVANVGINSWAHNRHPAEITVTPVATGGGQHDEPEQDVQIESVTITEDAGLPENPVDHYLDILGIDKGETSVNTQETTVDELLAPITISADADPLLDDTSHVDPFTSPLDDEKDQHDLSTLDDIQDGQGLAEPLVESDDGSLHQALNDMHSQF